MSVFIGGIEPSHPRGGSYFPNTQGFICIEPSRVSPPPPPPPQIYKKLIKIHEISQ